MNYFYLTLLGMALITFTCRYLFFAKTLSYELNPKIQKLLSYTAPSVLTAMWVPIVFLSHQESGQGIIQSPFLLAGLITVALSYKVKNTLLVVVTGISVFAALNFALL